MKRISLLAFCALLSGCLHAAPGEVKSEPATVAVKQEMPLLTASLVQQTIVKGKTTKKEILAAMGPPSSVDKNERQLPKELLATIKTELPPIARTKEFWRYRSTPPMNGNNAVDAADKIRVFQLMILFDDNDVAVDYVISDSVVNLP